MDIILVDTSVWINFFKGKQTPSSLHLKNNLGNIIIAVCPVVLQEVLQGITSEKDFRTVSVYFEGLLKLTEQPYDMAIEAAAIYRRLRAKGVTVRKPNDCLIAAYAIRNNIKLLHDNKDFDFIALHSNLVIESV
jgi:predicted nucleic acid-binding protein